MNELRSPSYLAMLYDRSYLRAEGSYGGEALDAGCAIEENFSSVYGAGFDVFNTKLILNKVLSREKDLATRRISGMSAFSIGLHREHRFVINSLRRHS